MPTFKSYLDKPGYYINARPSDVGNITYQVEPEAADFLLEEGYNHEDELPWGLVKPLRAAELVFTKNQGVEQDDDDVPELDPSKIADLSESELQDLLSYLEGLTGVPDSVIHRLQSELNPDRSAEDVLSEAVDQEFNSPTKAEIEIHEGNRTVLYIRHGNPSNSDLDIIKHEIHVLGTSDIQDWFVNHDLGDGWRAHAKVARIKASVMEVMDDVTL